MVEMNKMSLADLEYAIRIIESFSDEDLYDLDEDFQEELREDLYSAGKKLLRYSKDLGI
jgi:hypothetical protein